MNDLFYLKKALQCAVSWAGACAPNPSVGAVIVKDGNCMAEGWHEGPGSPHAEVMVLEKAGQDAKGAVLYVTLEPCHHQGRTPPCTQAILDAGLLEVVYAFEDPNPEVCGQGAAFLNQKGIPCRKVTSTEIDHFYRAYQQVCLKKKPYLSAKLSMSLNGSLLEKGKAGSLQTHAALNAWTHQSRAVNDALLTSVQTVLADDPLFNARLPEKTMAKPVYVIDTHLNYPLDAQLTHTAETLTLLHATTCDERQKAPYLQAGIALQAIPVNTHGRLDLNALMKTLGDLNCMHAVWMEAGPTLLQAFFEANLLDTLYLGVAGCVVQNNKSLLMPDWFAGAKHVQWHSFVQDALCEIRYR